MAKILYKDLERNPLCCYYSFSSIFAMASVFSLAAVIILVFRAASCNLLTPLNADTSGTSPSRSHNIWRRSIRITPDQLLQIAPLSKDCLVVEFPHECRTAEQSAPLISDAFLSYGITHPAEAAAIVSLMSYETQDFRYNQNHFPPPGIPGQGSKSLNSSTKHQSHTKMIFRSSQHAVR